MSNVFNHMLICLCSADSIFLLCNLLALPFHFGLHYSIIDSIYPFVESCCHFTFSASIFLIIAITLERWQASYYELTFFSGSTYMLILLAFFLLYQWIFIAGRLFSSLVQGKVLFALLKVFTHFLYFGFDGHFTNQQIWEPSLFIYLYS